MLCKRIRSEVWDNVIFWVDKTWDIEQDCQDKTNPCFGLAFSHDENWQWWEENAKNAEQNTFTACVHLVISFGFVGFSTVEYFSNSLLRRDESWKWTFLSSIFEFSFELRWYSCENPPTHREQNQRKQNNLREWRIF